LVHGLQALLLVQRHAGHHVHGRGDELDAHGAVCRTALLSLAERGLDGVDALVGEAGDLDVGADLDGLRGQAALDVGQQVVLDLLGDVQVGEYVGVVLVVGAGGEYMNVIGRPIR
jgi:hypothetical protein